MTQNLSFWSPYTIYGLTILLTSILLASCGGSPPISINVVYSSEKREWLEPLITEFNQSQEQVRVQGYATGSIGSIGEIIEEINTPTVWAPASSIFIPLASEEWRRIYGTELIDETPQSLVLSPVVIAVWREMAETLGWPAQEIGWTDIARLATSDQGWGAFGRPEWGPFKFGHTNPESSNSGLVSLLAIAYAASGKQSNLTAADLSDPEVRAFVEKVMMNVSHYGSSTGFFAESMFHCENGGPAYLSAAILYENLVVVQERKRLTGSGCEAKHPPVVAIYPVEGTFWADHPYIILNAPWIRDEQRSAARTFEAFLHAEAQQRRAMALGYRPADPKIPLTSPLDRAHGIDPEKPDKTLENPPVNIIRELMKLWMTS